MAPAAERPTTPLFAFVPPFATGLIELEPGRETSAGQRVMNPVTVGSGMVRL
jgi:hypothetical protein